MTSKSTGLIRRIYGIVLSISIVCAALCLCAACLGIYDGGSGEFSREAVAAAFSPIAVPVFLCLFLIAMSFPLNWFFPREAAKRKAGKNNPVTLQRLHGKTDLTAVSAELRRSIEKEQKHRKLHRTISLSLLAASFLIFLVYVLTGDRFLLPDITTSMKQAMLVLLPCLALTFAYSVFTHFHCEKSMEREIEWVKQARKEGAAQTEPKAQPETKLNLNTLRAAILLIAVAVLLFGYFTGGTADVLTKAINICTECVGLG